MICIEKNACAKRETAKLLSVLIPFYGDDPTALLQSLAQQSGILKDVEIILYDDGSPDGELYKRLVHEASEMQAALVLYRNSQNKGRSFARNALTKSASADWVLFLDADMLPLTESFLGTYLNEIKNGECDILFGGFEVPRDIVDEDTKLHSVLAQASDCHSAEERQQAGPQYVCSSNLCVRKSVLAAEPFDPEFKGWGWEDSEWAARVSKKYRLKHIDNPALHLGLESTQTLLRRFKSSGENYQRFVRKHPDLAPNLKLYQISKKLGKIPGQSLIRPVYKSVVLSRKAPTKARVLALKLWRASWYAEALS